jgi:hypothetical protein
MLTSFQSNAHTIPDPTLVEQISRIKAIDNHSHMRPATADQSTEKEPAKLLRSRIPDNRPDNLQFIYAWRDLYGYKYNDTNREHLSFLFKERQRIKREQGENYPTWVLDKLGIEAALVNQPKLGLGQSPPRFYWVPLAGFFLDPLYMYGTHDHHMYGTHDNNASDRKPSPTLEEYTKTVVSPSLESYKQEGAIAIKFGTAYTRPLNFNKVSSVEAAFVYEKLIREKKVSISEKRKLEDYLFRYTTQEAGRLNLKVHIHTGKGTGPYFNISGSNPMLLESVFNDPDQRNTIFVMIHGGWPFERQAGALLIKPNVYADFSAQTFRCSTHALSRTIRDWLEVRPEKVLFGTDAVKFSPLEDWEEVAWLSTNASRNALAVALTDMMNDRQITYDRALELAKMVLRTNALRLYDLELQ